MTCDWPTKQVLVGTNDRRDARPGRPLTPRVDRVAIVDFDVHHGNGTEAIIKAQPVSNADTKREPMRD